MASIAVYPKQFFPFLQSLFAGKGSKSGAALWVAGAEYRHAITALSAKLVRVDGAASQSELAAFNALFPVAASQAARVQHLFQKQLQDRSPALQYARQLRALGTDRSQRMALLEQLIQLANCDAPLNVAELEMIRDIAKSWGIDADALRTLVARVLKSKSTSPYTVLGVSRRASDAVVRARYMEQVRFLHPDQFAASGASEETVAILSERLADVNAAYNQITRMRGGRKSSGPSRRGLEPTKGARN